MKVRKNKKDIAKIPHVVSSFLDAMTNIKAVAMANIKAVDDKPDSLQEDSAYSQWKDSIYIMAQIQQENPT
jgi:hypothetical protein